MQPEGKGINYKVDTTCMKLGIYNPLFAYRANDIMIKENSQHLNVYEEKVGLRI